jgi:D-xylose transport system permease protein
MALTEQTSATAPNESNDIDSGPRPSRSIARSWSKVKSTVGSLELDTRLFGMVAGLAVIWIGFHVLSGGTFLTPRNLWNLTVQTSVVAIMATGMVLVIVSRNIDLSVGSMMGFVGMAMALLQAEILPKYFGFDQPYTWILVLVAGMLMGGLIGSLQGAIVAYASVPSFIVTLGGLLIWRGLAWVLASGRTIAPMDSTFQLLGGGARGSVGGTISWIIGIAACVGILLLVFNRRRTRLRFGFRIRPMWADLLLGGLSCAIVLLAVWFLNRYYMPENLARRTVEGNGGVWPDGGLDIPFGIANPVLIAIGTALVVSFIATRRKIGRYIFAIGGNPEAAALGGIKTKKTIVLTFMVMGVLVGLAAGVQIARLNSATSGLGTLQELYVIAAAVIGGTSLAGGVGTIFGAVLGALVMQSLQSGMVLVGIETALQDVVVGVVLVAAVAVDGAYRRRQAS